MIVNTPTADEIIKYTARKSGKNIKAIKEAYLQNNSLLSFLKATLDIPAPSTTSSSDSTAESYKVRAIKDNIRTLIPNLPSSNVAYLDHGCGDGTITMALALVFSATSIAGIDVYAHPNIDPTIKLMYPLTNGDIPSGDGEYDVITCLLSLHHVPKEQQKHTLSELARILKPGGTLLIYEHDVQSTSGKTTFNLRMYLDAVHMIFMFYGSQNENAGGGSDPRLITPGDVQWIFDSTYHSREWYREEMANVGLVPCGYYAEKNRQMMYYESFTKPIQKSLDANE